MSRASARHILVATEQACQDLKTQIEGGADFAALARQHSSCPSGRQGGDLGEFSPGQMVREFDEVVFSAELNKVQGPVKTQFGYHLLEAPPQHEVAPDHSFQRRGQHGAQRPITVRREWRRRWSLRR
jgi:peptidyl-prolyl cis-trans isomerase C